jgi:phosphohistidine phosphatase
MQLYLLRHALAVDPARFAPRDEERPLSPEGRKKMIRAARGMWKLGLAFDLILTSPLVRAEATADLVAREFSIRRHVRRTDGLKPEAAPRELVRHLAALGGMQSVLLVGHEPQLGHLLAMLLGVRPPHRFKLKKGALCRLEVEELKWGSCARLEWLLTCRQLGQLAD